ncbi:hypothetical protein P8452_64388 [Trifolium repens]|nr:hypothetical protein P8452_64388 [Trifolium repens]
MASEFPEVKPIHFFKIIVTQTLHQGKLVHIFENSALEINYPFQGNKPPSGENCRAPQKRKANSSFEFLQQCKIGKSQKVVVHHIDKKCKGKQVITTAVERAKSFKTYNPSFVLAMGASYVEHRFLLTIPSKFGKTHFDLKKKRGDIYFQVLNGRVWPARYTIRRRCSTELKFELTSGWKKFAKDNNLKVGDACNFELILSTNMTFQVEIFREKENGNTNCSTSQRKCSIMANESPHMKPTHFFKIICDQNLHEGKLIMPRKFDAKRVFNGQKKKANLTLQFQQPCEIGSSSCVKVEKLQKVAALNHIDKKCKGEQLVIAKKVTALDRAISFKTCNPSFHVVMCPSYLDGPSNLHIPSEFGKRHLLDLDNKQGDIHLRLLNDKVWQAKYRIRIANGVQRYEMYSSGWKEFAKDNNLKTIEFVQHLKNH